MFITGSWYCPWHHCDVCGRSAVKMCQDCPNSFCTSHLEGNLVEVDGFLYCTEHDDLDSISCASSVTSSEPDDECKKTASKDDGKASGPNGYHSNSTTKPDTKGKKKGKSDNIPAQKAITNLDRKISLNKKDRKRRDSGSSKSSREEKNEPPPQKSSGKRDPLAVGPMFDDSDDDRFDDLVIDIPIL